MSFRFDMTEFSRGLDFARSTSRKGDEAFLRTQARGMVRTLLETTPPSRGVGRSMASARRAGEAAIRRDVSRVVFPVRKGRNAQFAAVNPAREIDARRNRTTGRVSRAANPKIPVLTPDYRAEIKRRTARVGKLAAGWAPAARRLGVRVPAWINRHPGQGHGGEVRSGGGRVAVKVANTVPWNGSVRGLNRRVQFALDVQGRRMERAAESYWKQKLAGAGFDVRA